MGVVTRCTCVDDKRGNKVGAAYQDSQYGKGMRLHNECGWTGGHANNLRCTVCGNVKSKGGGEAPKTKKNAKSDSSPAKS
jgi:hypothetical protein